MPHPIGAGQVEKSQKLHSDSAWIWLFEIEVGSSEVAFLTPYDEQVVFDGDTYQPFPMTVPTVPEAGTTNANSTTMTVHNVDDLLTNRLRDDELIGNKIRIRIVHEDHLSETDIIAHEATILGAESVREQAAIKFTIGARNWINKIFGRRFLRNRCHHSFGSSACGYNTSRAGSLQLCGRTFTDCEERGDDEETNGLLRLHPRRFGGFKGLPKQNRG